MAIASLSASLRSDTGKGVARTLRAAGQVPAVIYGHARAPQSLALNARELGKLLERIAAEATVIELSIDGTMARTLIREVQRHPFKKQILHVDFQELVAGEKVTVTFRSRSLAPPKASASTAPSWTSRSVNSRSAATRRSSRATSTSTSRT